jgi:hypothetical protein
MNAQNEITTRVRRVLWEEWDPIHIRKLNAPADEYDSYIPGLVKLLQIGASARELTAHLVQIEDNEMGLTPNHSRAERAAAMLVALLPKA